MPWLTLSPSTGRRFSGATWADPAISRAIEQVGCVLAGEATGPERELAYAVAAAQVDLARAREAGRKYITVASRVLAGK